MSLAEVEATQPIILLLDINECRRKLLGPNLPTYLASNPNDLRQSVLTLHRAHRDSNQ